ncbi:hypothetical protein LIER_02851 [Lithospermum erythrorhizon]|uniref:Uncharacterized protein n=1 Tax=Lithospermum erythrorhizon TaxID=34254 RepID=A0AAV3NR30_LITER
MTGTTTIEEQIFSLTKRVEDIAKHMQQQEEALSNMVGRIYDHEQLTQAAEGGLRTLPLEKAPIPSKESPTTYSTPPHQASNMSKGQLAKVVKAPCISADGTIPAAQLREFILGAIKDTQDEVAPSYSYVKPYNARIDRLRIPRATYLQSSNNSTESGTPSSTSRTS